MTERRSRASLGAAMAAGVMGMGAACDPIPLDALTAPGPLTDAATAAMPGDETDAVADATTDGVTDASTDGPEALVSDAPSESAAVGESLPSDEASTQACTATQPPLVAWNFDSSVDGWILSSSSSPAVTMSWSGSTGYPSPGALEVDLAEGASDAAGPTVAWVNVDMTALDLAGRTVAAWVWLDSGPSPLLLSFVQTQTSYAWADNGELQLAPGTWTCVSLQVSSPATMQSQYDPTQIFRIGFEVIATAPFRLFIDSVRAE